MSVIDVKTADFETEVLKSDKTVLVDFWAVWCGPCRMLSPVVDQVAEENPDIKVCKVNVDEEQQLAIKYGVMSIPTLLVFKGGELVNQSVGVIPKEEVLNLMKVILRPSVSGGLFSFHIDRLHRKTVSYTENGLSFYHISLTFPVTYFIRSITSLISIEPSPFISPFST